MNRKYLHVLFKKLFALEQRLKDLNNEHTFPSEGPAYALHRQDVELTLYQIGELDNIIELYFETHGGGR